MNNSFATFEEYKNYNNRSLSYRSDGLSQVQASSLDALEPAGSTSSTINDMSRWVGMLLQSGRVGDKEFLTKEQLDFFMSPSKGFRISGENSLLTTSHLR